MNKRQRKKVAKKKAAMEVNQSREIFVSIQQTAEKISTDITEALTNTFNRLVESLEPVFEIFRNFQDVLDLAVKAYNRSKQIKMIEYKGEE